MTKRKKVVGWFIYKKTVGYPYPGEQWSTCRNERDARQQFAEFEYWSSGVFHIVKATLEAVDAKIKRARK